MESVDIKWFGQNVRGRPYRALVQSHLDKQTPSERQRGLFATIELLPQSARPLVERFIDRWNDRARDPEFWTRDCADVFDEIIEDSERFLEGRGIETDDEILFNMFQIITVSYAYSADHESTFRQFTGLKSASVSSGSTGIIAIGVAIAGLVLANATDQAVLLILGWIIFGFGVLSWIGRKA